MIPEDNFESHIKFATPEEYYVPNNSPAVKLPHEAGFVLPDFTELDDEDDDDDDDDSFYSDDFEDDCDDSDDFDCGFPPIDDYCDNEEYYDSGFDLLELAAIGEDLGGLF